MRFNYLLLFYFVLFSCSSPDSPQDPSQQTIKYSLTINASSGGSVSTQGGSFVAGSNVSITATPDSEYVFVNWSNESNQNPLTVTVNSNQNLTANFEKRKYPLTVNINGQGTVNEEIISAGKTTTEYTSGSLIKLTAVPAEGWGFKAWSGTVSSTENQIQLTVDESKSILSTFIELPSPVMTLISSPTKMYTKGVADTLLISVVTGGGFKNAELSSDWGDLSIIASPEEKALEGDLIVQYESLQTKNVDYTRTIAGSDNLRITLTDQNDLSLTVSYTLRTQPEPLLNRNFVKSHLDLKFSRIKVDPRLIRFLNQRDNFSLGCYVDNNFGDTTNYNQNNNQYDGLRDVAYLDLDLDGYDDIVLHPIYNNWDNSDFASVKFPIEVYMYRNGEYIFEEILTQNGTPPTAFLVTKFLVGDFDNDGYPDLYCVNHGTDSPPYIDENQFFLFNDLESQGLFTQIDNPFNRNSHFGASADVDNDGDIDIYAAGLFPCNGNDRSCDFLINDGNRSFSKGSLIDDAKISIDGSESLHYFTRNISTSDLYDVDEDGKIDLLLHGRGSEDNAASFPWLSQEEIESIPYIASSGKIMFANAQGEYTLSEMKYIPHIPGYNKGLDFNIYDLDGDGQNEIIILLTGDGSEGEWSNSGVDNDNQNTTNYYQGYQIQICQLDANRNIIDVTNQFMNGNGQRGVGLGCENANFMFLQIGDYDDNGLLDLYCEDFRLGPNFVRWEWNGSKFIKMTEF